MLRARPARADVRPALDPDGAAARRDRRAGRHRARRSSPTPWRHWRSRREDRAADHRRPGRPDRRHASTPSASAAGAARSAPAPRSPAARSARPATSATSTGPSTIATEAFATWRTTPAPVRGALVQRLGELLRDHKADLGELVSIEAGKIRSEGLGEVQEMIDICDFAVGLSRQLHGLTIASERPGHRLMETWHPMGPCAVITAFNFPVAVWSWNAALALVAGDPVLWKPSDKTPLTALACDALLQRAASRRRRAGRPQPGAAGRARRRRRAGRPRGRGDRVGDRLDAHGPRRGARRGVALRPPDPRARRQQRRRSSPRRPTSSWPRGASPSRPSAPPASAARACAA